MWLVFYFIGDGCPELCDSYGNRKKRAVGREAWQWWWWWRRQVEVALNPMDSELDSPRGHCIRPQPPVATFLHNTF